VARVLNSLPPPPLSRFRRPEVTWSETATDRASSICLHAFMAWKRAEGPLRWATYRSSSVFCIPSLSTSNVFPSPKSSCDIVVFLPPVACYDFQTLPLFVDSTPLAVRVTGTALATKAKLVGTSLALPARLFYYPASCHREDASNLRIFQVFIHMLSRAPCIARLDAVAGDMRRFEYRMRLLMYVSVLFCAVRLADPPKSVVRRNTCRLRLLLGPRQATGSSWIDQCT
jgi:hypothetical protein